MFAAFFDSLFHFIEEGQIVSGGITWLGGVSGAFPTMVLLIHYFVPKKKGDALNTFSLLIPGTVLAHALGRVGCFFGGCCYGKVTDSVFGVTFPVGSIAAKTYPLDPTDLENTVSQPVLPTQLYEAVFELVLFILMMVFYKKLRKYFVETYCFAYGTFRFLLEFLRGDDRGATGFALSPSQIMSIILLVTGVLLVLYRKGVIFRGLAGKCVKWKAAADALPWPPAPKAPFGTQAAMAPAPTDTLRELHKLFEDGILSKEEYEKKKEDILKRM